MSKQLALVVVLLIALPQTLIAQTYEEELAAQSAESLEAWNTQDVDKIATSGFTIGFGFRNETPRSASNLPPEVSAQLLTRFFDSLEYYRIIPGETNTVIDGEIALVWGYHVEEFKHKGMPAEKVRVRGSSTRKRGEDGRWTTLLSHRDIQPFDEDGTYIQTSVE